MIKNPFIRSLSVETIHDHVQPPDTPAKGRRSQSSLPYRMIFILFLVFLSLLIGCSGDGNIAGGSGAVLLLSLLVPRIRANHPNHALAADDLAPLTNLLHRCSYLHVDHFRPGPLENRKACPHSCTGPALALSGCPSGTPGSRE